MFLTLLSGKYHKKDFVEWTIVFLKHNVKPTQKINPIGGFHQAFFVLNWMEVNLKCIDGCAAQERANDSKLHIFTIEHKTDRYSEHLNQSNDYVLIYNWPPLKYVASHETQELADVCIMSTNNTLLDFVSVG